VKEFDEKGLKPLAVSLRAGAPAAALVGVRRRGDDGVRLQATEGPQGLQRVALADLPAQATGSRPRCAGWLPETSGPQDATSYFRPLPFFVAAFFSAGFLSTAVAGVSTGATSSRIRLKSTPKAFAIFGISRGPAHSSVRSP
jgi:hypothetical protein